MLTPGIGPATDGAVGLALLAASHPTRQTTAAAALNARRVWSLDIKERIAGGLTDEVDQELRRPQEDALAPIHTAQRARATRSESIAQQIEKLAKERAHGAAASIH